MKPRKIHNKKVPQMNQETSLTRSKPSTKKKMNTQLMAEKKTKNYATKKTYLQFMAENRITLQWQKKTLLTTYGGKLLKKKTELWLITYSSAKEWMLQRISRYTQKHNWIVLYKF